VTLPRVEAPIPQRRSYVRIEAGRPVIVYHGRHGEQLQSLTVDLSGGGLLLDAADTLSIGEEVDFRLTLAPDTTPVKGTARVVRITPEGRCGLAFESITDLDRRRLVRFMFERERDERHRGIGPGS
jgi:c-di-GMP-binding flagellar brake protein YcgR